MPQSLLWHLAKRPASLFEFGELEIIPVFVTNSPHSSQILYFISKSYTISKRIKSERIKMSEILRDELEKVRPNLKKQNGDELNDQDMIRLEAELNELSNIIIDSYPNQRKVEKNRSI